MLELCEFVCSRICKDKFFCLLDKFSPSPNFILRQSDQCIARIGGGCFHFIKRNRISKSCQRGKTILLGLFICGRWNRISCFCLEKFLIITFQLIKFMHWYIFISPEKLSTLLSSVSFFYFIITSCLAIECLKSNLQGCVATLDSYGFWLGNKIILTEWKWLHRQLSNCMVNEISLDVC